jgi:hypothetical protein
MMAISTLWEFGMNPCGMWDAMTVTALWYGFMFAGVTLDTTYVMVFGC